MTPIAVGAIKNVQKINTELEDTITILSKYVNSMKIDNKQELDTLMKSLYTEALTMETI